MHVIAAKAICFQEAGKPAFVDYQNNVITNAKAMSHSLTEHGFHIVSGGTDNHLMLLDLRKSHPDMTGKEAQLLLEGANITLNRNTVPGETRSPFQTSGLRIGTPAITSRGMQVSDMSIIADIIFNILKSPNDLDTLETEKKEGTCTLRKFSITLLNLP